MVIKTIIDIRKPVSVVFKELVNPKNLPKWVNGFQKLESVKGRRPRKGSVSKQIIKDSQGIMEIREEILKFEKDKNFEIRLSHKNMETHQHFAFAKEGKTTRLTLTTTTRLIPAIMAVFSVFMKGQMRRQQEADLMKLKRLLED